MMQLLMEVVGEGLIHGFEIWYDNNRGLCIVLTKNDGKQTFPRTFTLEKIIKSSEELDIPNVEIALSQLVENLLKEFKNGT